MSKFNDSLGNTWTVEIDGLILDDVLEQTGVDLGDLSAGGLAEIETSTSKLVKVLLVLCADEIQSRGKTDREFAKGIVREHIDSAFETIVSAVGNFFPPSRWSEIQSRLEQQRTANQDWRELQPMMMRLSDPKLPPAMREAVMAAVAEGMHERASAKPTGTTTSAPSPMVEPSAIGPDDIPPTLAPNVLENAGLTPVV